MRTNVEFIKATINQVVTQQIAQRDLSIRSITDLTVDIVVSLLAANCDEEPVSEKSSHERGRLKKKRDQFVPAVPIDESVQDDYIVCLEDGMRFSMLKRHLAETYGMTPDQYRNKWGLPLNYPMTAPAYSRRRSEIARQRNLGRYSRR